MQFLLLLGLFVASCTSIQNEVMSDTVLPTAKSFTGNAYALSESEAVIKAEQFLYAIENSNQGNGEARSIAAMNLSEKNVQVETIIRYVEYMQDDLRNYELIPVYTINYTHKKSREAGGCVVLIGDKRVNKKIFVYSDTGMWDNENYAAQGFLYWFWTNVDEVIKSELEKSIFSLKTKSDPCEYNYEWLYSDNVKLLPQYILSSVINCAIKKLKFER